MLPELSRRLGCSVAGASREGFAIKTLLRAAPDRARAAFYRTATDVEVDLVIELPGDRLWAIGIQRAPAPFLVYSGGERYPMGGGVEAIGLTALADVLAALQPA